jgi:pyridoxamine 5'-phosphate oxidase
VGGFAKLRILKTNREQIGADLESLKRHEDYGQESLEETHLLDEPIEQFRVWLKDAEAANIYEPNAFVLGTVDSENHPRSRTVLLKAVDERGFFFATNYLSRKGEAIATNPNVSAVFGWYSMYRQVLIQGRVEKVSPIESDEYFGSRPHDSQVAAWSSHQSLPIENRAALDKQFSEALDRFENASVPRPEYWGGYRIIPNRIEFWKGRSNRMHDRIEFTRDTSNSGALMPWQIKRLQP